MGSKQPRLVALLISVLSMVPLASPSMAQQGRDNVNSEAPEETNAAMLEFLQGL